MPEQIKQAKSRKTNTYQNVAVLKILLNAIATTPKTQPEIIELTGLTNSTVSRWLRFLHQSRPGSRNLVYIAEWKRNSDRGNWAACWKFGYFRLDASKPKPMTQAQYCARYRAKQDRTVTQTEKGLTHVIK